MATTRNIVITYFNGTDYDTLYPQTQASLIQAGTFPGTVLANANSVTSTTTTQLRNIYFGTVDMIANSSALTTGDIYLCYE